MIGHCRVQGIRAVHLEVDHGNDQAAALYERLGFERQDSAIMTIELD
jgi:ribosomal protein S18 acetylase RimI-like enzyme